MVFIVLLSFQPVIKIILLIYLAIYRNLNIFRYKILKSVEWTL